MADTRLASSDEDDSPPETAPGPPPSVVRQISRRLADDSRSSIDSGSDACEMRNRKGPQFLRSIARRIHIAAHISRAKRAENVTEFDSEPVVDNNIPMGEVKRCARQESHLSGTGGLNVPPNGERTNASVQRQASSQSRKSKKGLTPSASIQMLSQEPVQSATRNYHLGRGAVQFWKNFAFEQEGRPYLKVNHDVPPEDVALCMYQNWKMPPPRIVALVISNVDTLREWSNVRQWISFQKGLMKAANTTNMWIFTNGTNIGASKLIGDAVEQEVKETLSFHSSGSGPSQSSSTWKKFNVVGVVREDMLKYADAFGMDSKVTIENLGNSPEEGKYELNASHTNYIIVRDNTVNKTGINMFILRIMQFLSTVGGIELTKDALQNELKTRLEVPDTSSIVNMEIPVVCLVIQGGYDCARLVLDCLKRQFPVVILRGSGGLADLLSYAYMELKQRSRDAGPWGTWDPEYVESYLKPEISSKIIHYFPNFRENGLARNIFRDRILECVRLAKQKGVSFITVLNMHNYSECQLEKLSVYMLRALFKSKPTNGVGKKLDADVTDDRILKELYLTLDWNCPDVAKSEVLIKDPTYVTRLQKDIFQSALLRQNREEFVDLFLTHGFRLHKFITPTRLRKLFKYIYNEEFFRTVCWEGVLGHSLLSKPSKYFIDTDLNWCIETCTGLEHYVNSDELYYNVLSMYVRSAQSAERKSLTILTMWAVFGNRQKLAKTLWKHSDQPLHLAIIVSMMYERLSWYVTETTLKMDLREQSRKFAELAVGVLDDCYSENASRAFDVLSEESPDWNHKTAVDLAANARTRAFLAHPCCQKWLTNTFLGEIRIRELTWGFVTVPVSIKILICAIFIFPMYLWVRFKPIVETKTNTVQELEQEEDERDGMDQGYGDESNLISGKGDNMTGAEQMGNMELRKSSKGQNVLPKVITKRNDYYTSLLRDREVFIRSQPPLWRMVVLMWSAPITKFYTYQMAYICFLALFSWALLVPRCGDQRLDTYVCIWTAMIVIESVRRTYLLYRKYTSVPVVYKCLEILFIFSFVFFYTLASVRDYSLHSPYARKVVLSIGLLYFYYRFIAIYLPISPTLGPLLYRLKLMITVDFANFLRMAVVIIISSGVVLQAVLYPDLELSAETFRQAFHRAWFSLFITPTSELESQGECHKYLVSPSSGCIARSFNSTSCPTIGFWPYAFAIQYFVLLKLILMTLLYALFAATASKLATESDHIWKYQRYILVADFANRLPLPAPLTVFCYIYYVLRIIYRIITCRYCIRLYKKRKVMFVDGPQFASNAEKKYNMKLSEEDYNFWRHLARQYSNKQEKLAEQADIDKKQWESIQAIQEEIEYEKKVLRQLKGKSAELERMMNVSHVYLENIKHLASIRFGSFHMDTSPLVSRPHHIIARQSPYPGTRIHRVPVPDKYVPWEVMWIDYDPVAYTKQKHDFSSKLESYVDEDILLLQQLQADEVKSKLPVYKWNCSSTNAAGITIDRTSWCLSEDGSSIFYKLSNGIPQNPMGRTGLRGRGCLPRWGPNHYVTLVITRWQPSKVPLTAGRILEFVVEKSFPRWDQLSLPSRFISGENLYVELQSLFKLPVDSPPWSSSDVMLNFFKSCCIVAGDNVEKSADEGLKSEMCQRGYMDDPCNTDHAWREVELWHLHFTSLDNLSEKMHLVNVGWRIITEDVFMKLPSGEANLLQEITAKLQPTIL